MKTLMKTVAAGALTVLSTTAAIADDINLRFAGVFPIDHQGTKMMEQVAADVNAAGVGLNMTVFPANQLGSGEALFEDVARGNIDFASAFIYSDTDPRLEFLSMPFLVSGWDDMDSVMRNPESEFSKILQEITDEYGVKVIAGNPEGFVGIVATKEPKNWNNFDEKGMNIRVWSSNVVKSMVESLGFQATTMAWGDIFPALQSGIVDGAICCTKTATYSIFAKSDVGSYFVEYNTIPEQTFYYGSERTLAKLNDEQKAAIEAAMKKASDDFFNYNRENDAAFEQKLVESGYTILKLTDEEQAAMVEHVRTNIWPSMESSVGKEVMDRLLAAGK
ncbi:TRAP transporter substrate-binding protein DctP [Aliiroseovarius crassostreae]|uniref:TRAP transporter substrate-binding protein DctP n=1 Tax=Aliiroseovarius crassostreae TaxID=154981 RepID=A0A9Q9LZD4_9RHOB|nr:TRAP transporter substrate-binding protein DctP [Aliiroseovarius crassostreae]UWP95464.1 TRAP transporter substrate-binding protein DctP [Aliiroseovarius crassostreae]UWQ01831.1 TRAP transporter substrate-binding protein DctP [Aliiroseovarius crassostreae]UWQ11155.1 TRAP transporter substrate-binding protein DctP [Aliiroseovarius crassostreae]